MAQRDISVVSQELVQKNAMVMTVAALTTLIGFALPWFRFETSLALDVEPEARIAFDQNFSPAGPLTVFTRFPLNNGGLGTRIMAALFLAGLMTLVVAALVVWRCGRPLWPVCLSLNLAPLLALIMIGAWLIVGTRVSFGYPYAQTIPWLGWWLTLLGLVVVFFSGLNVLKAASMVESAQ